MTDADADRAREIASRLNGITRDCYFNGTTKGLEAEYARQIAAALAEQREAGAALVEDGKACIDPVKCALGETACSHECGIRRRLAKAIRAQA